MSHSAQEFLHSFDSLPAADKHQVTIEILRRVSDSVEGDLPESGLIETAEEIFLALDAEEY